MAITRPASTVNTPSAVAERPAQPAHVAADSAGPAAETGGAKATSSHIRRCTFRRVLPLPDGRRELPVYHVDCLHPSYHAAVPLGDLDEAYSACAACTLPGRFRDDED